MTTAAATHATETITAAETVRLRRCTQCYEQPWQVWAIPPRMREWNLVFVTSDSHEALTQYRALVARAERGMR